MSDGKVIDFAKMFSSKADKFGYKLGGKLPSGLEGLLKWLSKKGELGDDLERLSPEFYAWITKLVELGAEIVEVPRDKIPVPGFLGDLIYEFLNEAIDAAGRGAGDAGDAPKAGDKPAEPKKDDPGLLKGFVIGGQFHKSNCTTVDRPRGKFKADKPPEDITLADAIKRRHALSYCGCWGTPSETDQLAERVKASIAPATTSATTPVPTTAKAETKAEAPKSKPEPKPGSGTLFALLRKLSEDEPFMFAKVSDLYRSLTAKDMDLKKKFFQAFHNNGSYEDLKYLLTQPNDLWDEWLDDYIGEPTPEKRSTLARQREEFERMFLAVIENLDRVPAWAVEQRTKSHTRSQKLDDEWEARKLREQQAARRNRIIGFGIVILGVLAYLYTHNIL